MSAVGIWGEWGGVWDEWVGVGVVGLARCICVCVYTDTIFSFTVGKQRKRRRCHVVTCGPLVTLATIWCRSACYCACPPEWRDPAVTNHEFTRVLRRVLDLSDTDTPCSLFYTAYKHPSSIFVSHEQNISKYFARLYHKLPVVQVLYSPPFLPNLMIWTFTASLLYSDLISFQAGVFSFCSLALATSSSSPCPTFLAINQSEPFIDID
ncbi:hypothetical protein STEG23_012340 [Scotinomys teguina]